MPEETRVNMADSRSSGSSTIEAMKSITCWPSRSVTVTRWPRRSVRASRPLGGRTVVPGVAHRGGVVVLMGWSSRGREGAAQAAP
jgi:hypothetical protein